MSKMDTLWGLVHSAGGSLGTVEQRPVVRTDGVVDCFVLYGPYIDLPPGSYAAAFGLRYAGEPDSAHEEIGSVDVFRPETSEVIAQLPITPVAIVQSGGRILLPFRLGEDAQVEFRLYIKRSAPLIVDQDRDLYADRSSFSWLQARPAEGKAAAFWKFKYDGYLIRNFDNLKRLAQHGAEVFAADGAAEIVRGGVHVRVKNGEDLQVYTEIYDYNSYAFALKRNAVCVDVGMNVGMASLFFANLPNVVEVHSFEPFQAPRDRAAQNFASNPELAKKISVYDYGLSDKSESLSLPYDPSQTISAGIHWGSSSKDAETVQIKVMDAAEALRPIIEKARAQGCAVVVKIDCEGSEFAIVRSLASAGLLPHCDVVMMEWHKWFSRDLDETDLIGPLTESGHVVFDRTRVSDEATGLLFSVLAAPAR